MAVTEVSLVGVIRSVEGVEKVEINIPAPGAVEIRVDLMEYTDSSHLKSAREVEEIVEDNLPVGTFADISIYLREGLFHTWRLGTPPKEEEKETRESYIAWCNTCARQPECARPDYMAVVGKCKSATAKGRRALRPTKWEPKEESVSTKWEGASNPVGDIGRYMRDAMQESWEKMEMVGKAVVVPWYDEMDTAPDEVEPFPLLYLEPERTPASRLGPMVDIMHRIAQEGSARCNFPLLYVGDI